MNKVSVICLSVGIIIQTGIVCGEGTVSFETVKEVERTRNLLHGVGIVRFIKIVEKDCVSAPGIHSKYWVDRFTREDPELAALETAYRDFGLDYLKEVDKLALRIFRNPDKANEQVRAEMLLRIASWIGAPGKFENYRIAMRTEEAATIPLLRIIVDADIPVGEAESLISRFTTQQKSASVRAEILYEESNGIVDMRELAKRADAGGDLFDREWIGLHEKSYKHFGRRVEYLKSADILRSEPDGYAFFTDDSFGAPYADSAYWDCKLHMMICVYRSQADALNALTEVLQFRKLAGSFPRVDVQPNQRERDAYENWYARKYEWILRQHRVSARTAAAYYVMSMRNTFADPQTRDLLERRERLECARKNEQKGMPDDSP